MKRDNYTYKDYFGEDLAKDELNDRIYKEDVTSLLNSVTDPIKKQEMLAMVKEQHPKNLHFCSNKHFDCPYIEDIIKEFKNKNDKS